MGSPIRNKTYLKVGTRFGVPVNADHIEQSIPCNKDVCMLSLAIIDYLTKTFGEHNYKLKSTNHGSQFDIRGRRHGSVFDTKTAEKIKLYDDIFQRTGSRAKARAAIKPFKAYIMIEANTAVPAPIPMSEAKKTEMREYKRKHPKSALHDQPTRRRTTRRALSM